MIRLWLHSFEGCEARAVFREELGCREKTEAGGRVNIYGPEL